MRILVLSQYFWPEGFIINDIVRLLAEDGHVVTVATGKPNYPDGAIFKGYRAGGCQQEHYLGTAVKVVRVPLRPRYSGGAINLALNYLSFVASGLVCFPWLLRGNSFDAILVFAPSPIMQSIPAIPLKWIKGARLALWVQDLWPESLSATGFVKNRWILGAVAGMVGAIYRSVDLLLVQSKAFVAPVRCYSGATPVIYYPNSIDASAVGDSVPNLPAALSETLERYFCVVFAGNLGGAQGLDTVVEAARLLGGGDIRIVLVGSGSRSAWLEEQKAALNLDNLVLPGRFPSQAMPAIFGQAGALLVSLSDEPVFAQTIPSKVQAYLAAGKPIVASINGEGARVALESGAALVSAAGDAASLAENIRRLARMSPLRRAAMGESGRRYFQANFEMRRQVRTLVALLADGAADGITEGQQ